MNPETIRQIERYIELRNMNEPITPDFMGTLPAWLQDLENRRQAFEKLVLYYQSMPSMSTLYIPAGMRKIIKPFIKWEEQDGNSGK